MLRLVVRLNRNHFDCTSKFKHTLDYTRLPKLVEEELDEQFVRGTGPGGQCVSKTSNCVVLRHEPTGIVVKCHQTRSLNENRKRAREILLTKLDNFINEEHSIEAQTKLADEKRRNSFEKKQQKLRDMKKEWKIRNDIK